MDDRFSALTKKEIKAMVLLEFSADLGKDAQKQKLKGMIEGKNLFTTSGGLEYEKAFLSYVENEKAPVKCVLCDSELSRTDLFICNSCRDKLKAAVKEGAGKNSPAIPDPNRKPSRWDKKKEKIKRKREQQEAKNSGNVVYVKGKNHLLLGILLGIIISFIFVGILFGLYQRNKNQLPQNRDVSDIPKAYGEMIKEYGYDIGECTIAENGSIVYELLPKHDALIIYPDKKNMLDGATLVLSGTTTQDRTRQMMLMSLLNMTIYTKTDSQEMMDMVGEMVAAGGEYSYQGYRWNLVPIGNNTYYFIVTDNGEKKITDSNDNHLKMDATYLLGSDFSVAENTLGKSVSIIAENTRYFENSGISVVYDTGTGKVIYIDQDGSGKDGILYGIMGIFHGMTREETINELLKYGLEAGDMDAKTWSYSLGNESEKRELAIEFENDKVILISLKTVN